MDDIGLIYITILLISLTFSTKLSSVELNGKNHENLEAFSKYLRSQGHSLIQWKKIDALKWLDYHEWKKLRKRRDDDQFWEFKKRYLANREVVGRAIKCIGKCIKVVEEGHVQLSFRTILKEGDEIQTVGDSFAWIFLMDGSLLRLGPETSLILRELNVGVKEFLIFLRLNHGFVQYLSRLPNEIKESNRLPTDLLFEDIDYNAIHLRPFTVADNLPVEEAVSGKGLIKNSKENFFKKEDILQESDLTRYIRNDDRFLYLRKNINRLIRQNNSHYGTKPTHLLFVMPNGTLYGKNISFSALVYNSYESFVRKKLNNDYSFNPGENYSDITFYYRGYLNRAEFKLEDDQWYKISKDGKAIEPYNEETRIQAILSFFIRRVDPILYIREVFLDRYSKGLFGTIKDWQPLAKKYGYWYWSSLDKEGSDLDLRMRYLIEFTRRVETSNLLAMEKMKERVKRPIDMEGPYFKEKLYKEAFALYLRRLKRVRKGSLDPYAIYNKYFTDT